ncbi:MAG: four helix bundle protein [Nitrospirae bacterium]|nr:MAG: four helix bundle protein [Nitrospirota bacterium]
MERPHKKLSVWKEAIELALLVYRVTEQFPGSERFNLIDQLRRAAVSVSSNIAEGAGRQTKKEFVQFLYVAQGPLSELDTQFELAQRLGYLDGGQWKAIDEQLVRVAKLLSGLIRHEK